MLWQAFIKKEALVPLPFCDAHMDFLHGFFCMKLCVNKLYLHLSSKKTLLC